MLQYFQGIPLSPLTAGDFVLNVMVACLCGLIHIAFYRAAYRGPGYSASFLNSLVLLTIITAVVIMVIGDSLARAFGLVGAMSIIRFRTAVKEVLDIVHIFLALAIGMTAGVGLLGAAFAGTILLGIIYYMLIRFNVGGSARKQFVVQFTYTPPVAERNGHEPPYIHKFQSHCRQSSLLNVKSVGDDSTLEISYYIKPKSDSSITSLLTDLRSTSGVRSVAIFNDEEQF